MDHLARPRGESLHMMATGRNDVPLVFLGFLLLGNGCHIRLWSDVTELMTSSSAGADGGI